MIKQKSLIKNSIFNVLYKLMNVIFPLITSIYVSRVILSDGVGKVSFASNIVSYFTLLAVLGIPSYGPREIGKQREQKEQINKICSELFFINLISSIVFSIGYLICIFSIERFNTNIMLFLVCGIPLFLNCINVDWMYQGIEEYGYIAIRSFVVKIIGFISLFIFVRTPNDYIIYGLINALSLAFNYFFNIIHLRKKIKLSLKELNIKKHLKPVLFLLVSSLAVELYTALDVTMLGFLCSDSIVGYYNNAIKIIKIIQSLITSISAVLLPRLSYYFQTSKIEFNKLFSKALKVLLIFAVPATLGIFILSDKTILILYGVDFEPTINTLRILSLTLPLLVLNVLFGIQGLISTGNETKYLITVSIGAIVNLCLNMALINRFQQNGAALASLISESCVMISSIIFSRKIVKVHIDLKYVISIIVASCAMVGSLFLIFLIPMNDIVSLIISIIAGAIIYFLVLFLLKEENVMNVFNRVIKKFSRRKVLK